jgi:hypothetical protein
VPDHQPQVLLFRFLFGLGLGFGLELGQAVPGVLDPRLELRSIQ